MLWVLMRKGGPALSVVAVWFGGRAGSSAAHRLPVFIASSLAVVLKALGKDPSLTGRTD